MVEQHQQSKTPQKTLATLRYMFRLDYHRIISLRAPVPSRMHWGLAPQRQNLSGLSKRGHSWYKDVLSGLQMELLCMYADDAGRACQGDA